MRLKVVVHKAEEGGYWAEVPALRGCATQGETWDELVANIQEAVEGVLEVMAEDAEVEKGEEVVLAV